MKRREFLLGLGAAALIPSAAASQVVSAGSDGVALKAMAHPIMSGLDLASDINPNSTIAVFFEHVDGVWKMCPADDRSKRIWEEWGLS